MPPAVRAEPFFQSRSKAGCHSPRPLHARTLAVYMEGFSEPYALDKANRYEIIRTVGRGSFGEVMLAWDTQSGRTGADGSPALLQSCPRKRGHRYGKEQGPGYVALKTVASGVSSSAGGGGGGGRGVAKGLFRELRALQNLEGCSHVVRLLDVYPEGANAVLVLEYMPSDLAKVLDSSAGPLGEADCKAYSKMLLRGLAFMHSHGLLHRDIKPSNLLISAGGVLKIADFGQTRTHMVPQERSYSHQVATRWYRSPELLYGARRYGFAVDMWAAGAVVGEMLAGRPLFQGRSDIDQLNKILQVTGTPTEASWPGVAELPDFDKVCFADMPPQPSEVVFQGSSKEACDFAAGMLCLDPRKRTSAIDALRHRFFFVAPEATPYHLLHQPCAGVSSGVVHEAGGGERCLRGAAYLAEGWLGAIGGDSPSGFYP